MSEKPQLAPGLGSIEAGKKQSQPFLAVDDTQPLTDFQRGVVKFDLQHETRLAITDHHRLIFADELISRLEAVSLDPCFVKLCRSLAREIGVSVPEAAAAIYPVARTMHQAALIVRRAL